MTDVLLTSQAVALDAMAAENAGLKQWAKEADELWVNDCDLDSHLDSVPQTPATEAYLNSVRAEGVEILTSRLQTLIDEGVFDAKEIGVAAGAVYEGAQIAANLRSGTHDTADKAG